MVKNPIRFSIFLLVVLGAILFFTRGLWMGPVENMVSGQTSKPAVSAPATAAAPSAAAPGQQAPATGPAQAQAPAASAPTTAPAQPAAAKPGSAQPTAAAKPAQQASAPTAAAKPAASQAPAAQAPTASKPQAPAAAPVAPAPKTNLKTVEIGTVPYAPYSPVIVAQKFGPDYGVDIRIVNLYGREAEQGPWVKGEVDTPPPGVSRLYLTTQNSSVMVPGTRIAFAVGQSNGADALVSKGDITSWNDAYNYPIAGSGYGSVGQYITFHLGRVLGRTQVNYVPEEDVTPAIERWASDPNIKTVAVYEPFTTEALNRVPGSRRIITSKSWAGVWDVGVIADKPEVDEALVGATSAYFAAIKLLSEQPDQYFQALQEQIRAHGESQGALVDATSVAELQEALGLEGMATLEDNALLFSSQSRVMEQRVIEAWETWSRMPFTDKYGNVVPVPQGKAPADFIDRRYVERVKDDPRLKTSAKPVNNNLALSIVLNLSEEAAQAREQKVGELPYIMVEFVADKTNFADERDADRKIRDNFIPIITLTNNTVLEIRGGYALPRNLLTEKDEADGRALALQRAEAVRQYMIGRYGIPADRVRVNPEARQPQFRGSRVEEELRQDRRVEASIFERGGL